MLKLAVIIIFFSLAATNIFANEQDLIPNEIVYDFPESDTSHEWVEFYNSGETPVTIVGGSSSSAWRFNDGSNHTISSTPMQGSMTINPGEFVVIAQKADVFLANYADFSGNLLESSAMSLKNTTATIGLRIGSSGSIWGEITYSSDWGAQGDGNSLQRKSDGSWVAAAPTPGNQNSSKPLPSPSPTPSSTSSSSNKSSSTKSTSSTSTKSSPKASPMAAKSSPSTSKSTAKTLGEKNISVPKLLPTSTPSASPETQENTGSSTKIAGFLTGAGAIFVGASLLFYFWYYKIKNKAKDPIEEKKGDS